MKNHDRLVLSAPPTCFLLLLLSAGPTAAQEESPAAPLLVNVPSGSGETPRSPFPSAPFDLVAGCVNAIRDDATGGCLGASSVPQLGMLHPLSNDFFIDPTTGHVGIGETNPFQRLRVAGTIGAYPTVGWGVLGHSDDPVSGVGVQGSGGVYGAAGLHATNGSFALLGHETGIGLIAQGAAGAFAGRFQGDAEVRGVLEADRVRLVDSFGPEIYTLGAFLYLSNYSTVGGMRFTLNRSSSQHWEFDHPGPTDTEARITASGSLQLDGSVSSPAADLAEYYPVQGFVEPGDVVAFGEGGTLVRAGTHESGTLAGIVSSEPAFVMGLSYSVEEEVRDGKIERPILEEIHVNGRAPLALAGRVPCKVTAENGPIRPGDHLTVSSIPGHAAKTVRSGPVVGTALETWDVGEGTIEVFVNVGWFSPDVDDRIRELEQRIDRLERSGTRRAQ